MVSIIRFSYVVYRFATLNTPWRKRKGGRRGDREKEGGRDREGGREGETEKKREDEIARRVGDWETERKREGEMERRREREGEGVERDLLRESERMGLAESKTENTPNLVWMEIS